MNQNQPAKFGDKRNTPISEIVLHLKLIFALLGDGRVNFLLKVIPILGFIYMVYPIDLVSMIPFVSAIDDIGVLWFTQYLFIELCPPNVVDEVRESLLNRLPAQDQGPTGNNAEEIIDTEFRDIDNP